MKYSDIKNIDGLETAIYRTRSRLMSKQKEITSRYGKAKEAYSPSGIIASGIRSISTFIPIDKLAIALIEKIKTKLI